MNFTLSLPLVSIFVGVAVLVLVVTIATLQYYIHNKDRKNKDSWFFSNWQEKLYDGLTNEEPIEIGQRINIDVETYLHNCHIAHINANLKKTIVNKVIGIIVIFSFLVLYFSLGSIYYMIIAICCGFPLYKYNEYIAKQKANERKFQLEQDLPRFLDLFATAIAVNIPVEEAITLTCSSIDNSVLSEELLATMADAQMGATNWQTALENLANDYQVDSLSDFVVDLLTSYEKGSSIQESIERQNKEIKKQSLLKMKERAAKLKNSVLVPIVLFKFVPMIGMFLIPVSVQVSTTL